MIDIERFLNLIYRKNDFNEILGGYQEYLRTKNDINRWFMDKNPILYSFRLDKKEFQDKFSKIYLNCYAENYSKDEVDKLLAYYSKANSGEATNDSIYLFQKAAEEYLLLQNNEITVEFKEILKWDSIINNVDAAAIVGAFMTKSDVAGKDIFNQTIPHTDSRLYRILKNGLSENHMHFKASGYSTELNWEEFLKIPIEKEKTELFFLMDKTRLHKQREVNLQQYLRIFRIFLEGIIVLNIVGKDIFTQEDMEYLLNRLENEEKKSTEAIKIVDKKINLKQRFNEMLLRLMEAENITFFLENSKNANIIIVLKFVHSIYMRYIKRTYKQDGNEQYKYVIGNEKIFYCLLFSQLNDKKLSDLDLFIFNMYILGKSKFIFSFVQDNEGMGFAKFKEKESVKEVFLADDNVLIKSVFYKYYSEGNVRKIEFRIAPKSKAKLVKFIQKLSKYNDEIHESFNKQRQIQIHQQAEVKKIDFGIIIHYIKDSKDGLHENFSCRKEHFRELRMKEANELINYMDMVDNSSEGILDEELLSFINKVVGIDAANFELNCRPENFAPSFRKQRLNIEPKHNFKITYHVGEEFLNSSNGLRAIDEAIRFFDLKRNDRLGHAIALGINIDMYMRTKRNTLITTLQDWVDDLCWMYYVLLEDNTIEANYLNMLEKDYSKYIQKLYNNLSIQPPDMYTYYQSMLLRGDDPHIYVDYLYVNLNEYQYKLLTNNLVENHKINYLDKDHIIAFLNDLSRRHYFLYHYNKTLVENGKDNIAIPIPTYYSGFLKTIQKKLKDKIVNLGISVEVNPSSNKKISMVKQYLDLPIFSMNSNGLSLRDDLSIKNNLPISICTDDSAIFQTSISNEYALIACALMKNNVNPEEVYQYIDYLRELSNQLSFLD